MYRGEVWQRSMCLFSMSHVQIVANTLPRAGIGLSRHSSQSLVNRVSQMTFHVSLSMLLNLNSHVCHAPGTYQFSIALLIFPFGSYIIVLTFSISSLSIFKTVILRSLSIVSSAKSFSGAKFTELLFSFEWAIFFVFCMPCDFFSTLDI